MTLSATSTFTVSDQATTDLTAAVTILPAAGAGPGGKGRLIHPTLGTFDYYSPPDETENLDRAGAVMRAMWARSQTLGGQIDVLWPGYLRDVRVIERWKNGDVGSPLAHLRTLAAMAATPPDPAGGLAGAVVWAPTYAIATRYAVVLAAVRVGGSEYRIDWRLEGLGYTPSPVELEMRILGLAP